MPDLNLYQRHTYYDPARGLWVGVIDEFPEIETVGASSTIAIGLLDSALINLIEQYQEEGWTVPVPGGAAPTIPAWMIVMAWVGIIETGIIMIGSALWWMPAGW